MVNITASCTKIYWQDTPLIHYSRFAVLEMFFNCDHLKLSIERSEWSGQHVDSDLSDLVLQRLANTGRSLAHVHNLWDNRRDQNSKQ